jgi:hypothetical protein
MSLYLIRKSKRDASNSSSTSQNINYLNVEYLIVLDSTAWDFFNSVYGNMEADLMNVYIKIYFIHIVNGVCLNPFIRNN